jgi:polar amino acid transport system substrate-binding protein
LQQTLIRIDVPVYVSYSVALVRDRNLISMPIGDLKHLRAGHIAGANYARKITQGFSEIWTGETPEQLLEMLVHDRVDLVVLGEETANKVLASKQVDRIFRLAQSPGVVCFYHYLHDKHAALVPRFEEALRRILGDIGDDPCAPPENGLLEEGNEIAYHAEAS